MHLTALPNELLKQMTQFLEHSDYMTLHRTSKLLYSKVRPYNFQAPTQNLERLLRRAPLDVIESMEITEWTDSAIVTAFVRGLPVCQKLIESGQISEKEYYIYYTDIPYCINGLNYSYNDSEETLLIICAMYGHNELIERLLDHGHYIDHEGRLGMTPLGCAIVEQLEDTCRLLLERGATMDLAGDSKSAMHFAAQCGTPEILEILVNAGGDVNHVDEEETPLHRAAQYGTVDNVQWLLEHSADLWKRGCRQRTALDFSVYNSDSTVFEYLLQIYLESDPPEYWKEDTLTNAAHARNFKACQRLLDLGANVNGNPHTSETPLFKSVCPNHIHFNQSDVYDLLMAHGAEMHVGDLSK